MAEDIKSESEWQESERIADGIGIDGTISVVAEDGIDAQIGCIGAQLCAGDVCCLAGQVIFHLFQSILILLEGVKGDEIIEDRDTIGHESDHKENDAPAPRIALAILADEEGVREEEDNNEENNANIGALQGEIQHGLKDSSVLIEKTDLLLLRGQNILGIAIGLLVQLALHL